MITLINAFVAAHLGAIFGFVLGAGGVVFGMFRHQQAKTVEAQAASTVAASKSQDDLANAAASAATTQAVVNRSDADAAAQAATPADINAQLAAIGAQRKD
ncbi:hypothetical protein [Burkholderia sp. PAMC 28687]|uniref:hypothetical protein n=1 Tax=Burkholderia sp. PAMC 28687 TaxID=1795874 RepID=UPI000A8C2F8B|nr:hypothetical protein [Burkholderia sp. PAMC 28687]